MEKILLTMGLPGVVILGLGYAVYRLWLHNVESQKANSEAMTQMLTKSVGAIEKNTAALDAHSDAIGKVTSAFRRRTSKDQGDP